MIKKTYKNSLIEDEYITHLFTWGESIKTFKQFC